MSNNQLNIGTSQHFSTAPMGGLSAITIIKKSWLRAVYVDEDYTIAQILLVANKAGIKLNPIGGTIYLKTENHAFDLRFNLPLAGLGSANSVLPLAGQHVVVIYSLTGCDTCYIAGIDNILILSAPQDQYQSIALKRPGPNGRLFVIYGFLQLATALLAPQTRSVLYGYRPQINTVNISDLYAVPATVQISGNWLSNTECVLLNGIALSFMYAPSPTDNGIDSQDIITIALPAPFLPDNYPKKISVTNAAGTTTYQTPIVSY